MLFINHLISARHFIFSSFYGAHVVVSISMLNLRRWLRLRVWLHIISKKKPAGVIDFSAGKWEHLGFWATCPASGPEWQSTQTWVNLKIFLSALVVIPPSPFYIPSLHFLPFPSFLCLSGRYISRIFNVIRVGHFHFSVGQEFQRLSLGGIQIVNKPPFSLVSLSIRKEKKKQELFLRVCWAWTVGIEKLEENVWGPKEHPQVDRDHFSTES